MAARKSLLLVLTTLPSLASARKISGILLAEKLAACVSIASPAESRYEWKGKVESSRERMVWIKTRLSLYKRLEKRLKELHPYECPEIAAFPASDTFPAYLAWVWSVTQDG